MERVHQPKPDEIHLFQKAAFVSICRHLLPVIHEGWRKQKHRDHLPLNVLAYLCGYLQLDVEQVDTYWALLRYDVESQDTENYQHLIGGPHSTTESVRRLYTLSVRKCLSIRANSNTEDLTEAALTLSVDFEYCPEEGCGKKLVWKPSLSGVLLTTKYGRLPVSLPSKYCNCEMGIHRLYIWITNSSHSRLQNTILS